MFVCPSALIPPRDLEGPFWMASWNLYNTLKSAARYNAKTKFWVRGQYFTSAHKYTKPNNLFFQRALCPKLFTLVCDKNLFSVFWSFIFNFLNPPYPSQTTWNLFQLWGNIVLLMSSTGRAVITKSEKVPSQWWEEYWQHCQRRRRSHHQGGSIAPAVSHFVKLFTYQFFILNISVAA